jgi:hypothetical protein
MNHDGQRLDNSLIGDFFNRILLSEKRSAPAISNKFILPNLKDLGCIQQYRVQLFFLLGQQWLDLVIG